MRYFSYQKKNKYDDFKMDPYEFANNNINLS